MQDNIPEGTNGDVLPQHVQCILPPTTVYKYLEYEERPDNDTTESKKYRLKFDIKNVSTPKEIETWVSEFAASSNIKILNTIIHAAIREKVPKFHLPSGIFASEKERN
jgi:hypothetical protein